MDETLAVLDKQLAALEKEHLQLSEEEDTDETDEVTGSHEPRGTT